MVYTIAVTEVLINQRPISVLAAAGKNSLIKLINLSSEKNESQILVGHFNEINLLKFHPLNRELLLSGSKDLSVRLWNIRTKVQICIFAGPQGHQSDVLSIDWHLSGKYFVSSGADYYIKIWEINTQVDNFILEASKYEDDDFLFNLPDIVKRDKNSKKTEITGIEAIPIFSTNTIHDNYVDCVLFNGNFIFSKSVNGIIYEWLPDFNKVRDPVFIINTYNFKIDEILIGLKMSVDQNLSKLIVGNNQGVIFIYDINNEPVNTENNLGYFNDVKEMLKFDSQKIALVRHVAIDEDHRFIAFVNDRGYLYIKEYL